MQYPVEVAGVSVSNFLRTAKTAIDGKAPAPLRTLGQGDEDLHGKPAHGPRLRRARRQRRPTPVAREKKRLEILQMGCSSPPSPSRRDADSALTSTRCASRLQGGVNRVHGETGFCGVMLIAHYTRILRYIKPNTFM